MAGKLRKARINGKKIVILKTGNLCFDDKLTQLAKHLVCPLITNRSIENLQMMDYLMTFDCQGRLNLQKIRKNHRPLLVDFSSGTINYRRLSSGHQRQMIARAVGLHQAKHRLTILDCTAGLGKDAFLLASLGCDVTLLERSSIIAALLADGIYRGICSADLTLICQKMHLYRTEADIFMAKKLEGVSQIKKFDVVYLDPMFVHNKDSAVKKDMQYLRDLLVNDSGDELLSLAYLYARYRIVVKRSRLSADLNNQSPNFRLIGKRNRFDVYNS